MTDFHVDTELTFGVPVTVDYIAKMIKSAVTDLLYLRRQIPCQITELEHTFQVSFTFLSLISLNLGNNRFQASPTITQETVQGFNFHLTALSPLFLSSFIRCGVVSEAS